MLNLCSVTVYEPYQFTLGNAFEKCAAFELAHIDPTSAEVETLLLPGGLYTIFDDKGIHTDLAISYILGKWLPGSPNILNNRPHFEISGEQSSINDTASEEKIEIPIQPR